MDVSEWLRRIGLGQYAQCFAENDVDLDVLPDLTEADLEKLGVSLGHRKKLLRAIAELSARNVEVGGEIAGAVADSVPESSPQRHEAERRQLTFLFCDLVDSTKLSNDVDPEDLHRIIRGYQDASTKVVKRFGGVVARYMGDGILVYFGYPQAHEDDAERAVRAGLGIMEAIGRFQPLPGLALQARVGISTGLVVVGDLIGEGVSEEWAASGEAANLAARLQALANPGSVVVSPVTRNLVAGLFEFEDLGQQPIKGLPDPVQVSLVAGEKESESRFEAAHADGFTPLVAREQEIELLMERWDLANQGEGQVVLLSGEPGIGKSRVTQTIRERISHEPHTRLRYQCSPYHTHSALYPLITQVEIAAGIGSGDADEVKLDKLEALLAPTTVDMQSVAPIAADMLSIQTGDRYPPLNLTPQQRKEKALERSVEQVLALAALKPVLFLFEDAHWVDPSTLEFLDLLLDKIQTAPVLMIITHRPEFSSPWSGHTHITTLTLNRLGRRHCQLLVQKVVGDKSFPAEVLDQIVAKTDGMPLFVEELTKTVLESGILESTESGYELAGPLPPLAIPTSLQDSLMARLDRLAPVKEVAQIGAAIGRTFTYPLIASVSELEGPALQDALTQLVNAELIFRRGSPPDSAYTFKHALVQDAAYESLLKSSRQKLHQQIATALEERFPDTAETDPELIAHHYTEAHLLEKGIDYWQRAGQRSAQRSASVEALAHLYKALELLNSLPESIERDRKELALRIDLTSPLIASKGMAAAEMGSTISRARELCERLGETSRLFPVLYGQWVFHHVSGKVTMGLEFAKEAARLAEVEDSEVPKMVAYRTQGIALIALGQPHAAHEHLVKGNHLYNSDRHRPLAHVYGMDFWEVNLAYLPLVDWFDGFPDRAAERARETVDFARSLSHVNSLCHALAFGAGTLQTFSRTFGAAKETGEELLRLSAEYNMPQWSLFGHMFVSFGLVAAGLNKDGLPMLRACLERCRAVPMLANSTLALTFLAEAELKEGDYQSALRSLDEADEIVESGGERWARSEILRLRGELMSAGNGDSDAGQHFQDAIELARKQPAKVLELRATTSLAQFWRRQGKSATARQLLSPLYGSFTEGFGSPDIKEARVLLGELS